MQKETTNKQKGSKSAKAGLQFPVGRIQRNLRKGNYANRIGTAGAVYMTAVLEYLSAEILEISGQVCQDHRIIWSGVVPNINALLIKSKAKNNGGKKKASSMN